MANLQQFQLMMEEIGPTCDPINAVVQLEDDMWGVACFDDRVRILVELDDEAEQLTLHAEHGTPREENRLKTYETMLTYNRIARDSGGIYMALEGPDGAVTQECDLSIRELDLMKLREVLENFMAKAVAWQGLVQGGGVSAEDAPSNQIASELGGTDPNAIRV